MTLPKLIFRISSSPSGAKTRRAATDVIMALVWPWLRSLRRYSEEKFGRNSEGTVWWHSRSGCRKKYNLQIEHSHAREHIGGLTVVVAVILTFSVFASIVEAKDLYQPKID